MHTDHMFLALGSIFHRNYLTDNVASTNTGRALRIGSHYHNPILSPFYRGGNCSEVE